jgi:hypothetical protein
MAGLASPQDAARCALERQLGLARQGRSMLYPFIGRSRKFEAWQHYPRNDAMDDSGRWQFYFHAHDRREEDPARHPHEHGHVHLFRRNPAGQLSHLAGLSLDARGVPLAWFATNQWVTGERWMGATSLTRGLQDLELRLRGPLAGAALWLSDMVRVYAGALRQMLQQRDEALAHYCARKRVKPEQAWADRGVSVWSSFPVQWPQDALQLSGHSSSSHPTRRSS